jgi:hypothetical protein
LGWQQICNNQHKMGEAKRCLSSQQEVAVRQLNWWHQLCNSWGDSNDNNDDNNNDNDNDAETITSITTTTAAGTVEISAGTDTAAALRQGLTTPGKRS